MNSGLTSLLDAIFGKKDLASVSLDEMYEVINEFPTFNAAHFLLSKKLKQLNDPDYERETMRTALYFNNAFWLQSVLDEENGLRREKIPSFEKNKPDDFHYGGNGTGEPPVRNTVELEEEISVSPVHIHPEFQNSENDTGPVSSFDELILKYGIEPMKPVNESREEFHFEELRESTDDLPLEPVNESREEFSFERVPESAEYSHDEPVSEIREEFHFEGVDASADELTIEPVSETREEFHFEGLAATADELTGEPVSETREEFHFEGLAASADELTGEPVSESSADSAFNPAETIHETLQDLSNRERYEIREEILNEYGIFEEVVVKKQDLDLEAFDRLPDEIIPASEFAPADIPPVLDENHIENEIREESPEKRVEADYEAFDRPVENDMQEENPAEPASSLEISVESVIHEPYEPDNTEPVSGEQEEVMYDQEQEYASPFAELQKSVPPFDTKKAESIVFAPYHMIDYFASQGIKLVTEDHPADHFGKQLKSFTDWLKVMKRLPNQPVYQKTDEKETERIRHFAAYSLEDRDILTESMAEVLAKQGMYENAIALYQKLSLIYPPKSAYFASRIEQLKASLP